ncbi:TetR family transcriptional regulator [Leucobacter chromiireducens]|uniref:TetR family transcriptional regulator n=1 Tax=Leucobacter chromiireducens subsp. solipictus TaxID=398235 RepID=A0ABS1SEP5_9MICO|nr:TetR family transcriptional regulator [Leucobacter chromiireducens subsp. solipictus]
MPTRSDATPAGAPDTEGVRQRNYRETHQRIHLAALALAERDGLQHMTTAQIAADAGISRRTFFRYFSCKEQAVLPGHRRYLDALAEIPLPQPGAATPADIVAIIDAVGDQVLTLEGDPELTVHRRVSALLHSEPELRAYGAAQDAEIAERMAERLTERFPDVSLAELTLLTEVGITAWRHGWIRWSAQAEEPGAETPAESHRATRAALRRAFCGGTA